MKIQEEWGHSKKAIEDLQASEQTAAGEMEARQRSSRPQNPTGSTRKKGCGHCQMGCQPLSLSTALVLSMQQKDNFNPLNHLLAMSEEKSSSLNLITITFRFSIETNSFCSNLDRKWTTPLPKSC